MFLANGEKTGFSDVKAHLLFLNQVIHIVRVSGRRKSPDLNNKEESTMPVAAKKKAKKKTAKKATKKKAAKKKKK